MYVRYNKNVIGLRLKLVKKVVEIDAMMGEREKMAARNAIDVPPCKV